MLIDELNNYHWRKWNEEYDIIMYMETTVFILCILLGIAILSMGVITCLQVIGGSIVTGKQIGRASCRERVSSPV